MNAETLAALTDWATRAAKEAVDRATAEGGEPDLDPGYRFWAAFDAAFPRASFEADDYGDAARALMDAYLAAVRTLRPAKPVPAPKPLPATERGAKLLMAKMHKAYEAVREGANDLFRAQKFNASRERRDEAKALYHQMLDLRSAASAKGWFLSNSSFRYQEDYPSARENRD